MTRFIFRKLSTEDLLQASATTDRLYRVAQHHMYLSDGALLVRSGQDTAATVTDAFDVRNVSSLYLADVHDFDRDVPRQFFRPADSNGNTNTGDSDTRTVTLDVLHVSYARNVRYTDLPAESMHRLLSGIRAKQVCFSNVVMTADEVAEVVSALLEAGGCDNEPPVLRCSYDRMNDEAVLTLLDLVECTCAGLLAEFRVTVRRPAPHTYAIYPMSSMATYDDDGSTTADRTSAVAAELPEDLLAFTAFDCSGFRPSAYQRLSAGCRRLRRLCMKAARQADDDAFETVAAIPSLQHLDMDGLYNVTSDGLLNGKFRISYHRTPVIIF